VTDGRHAVAEDVSLELHRAVAERLLEVGSARERPDREPGAARADLARAHRPADRSRRQTLTQIGFTTAPEM
jgi:hypothetical protein